MPLLYRFWPTFGSLAVGIQGHQNYKKKGLLTTGQLVSFLENKTYKFLAPQSFSTYPHQWNKRFCSHWRVPGWLILHGDLLEVDSIPIFTTRPRFLQMWLSAMGALEMNGRWGLVLLGWGLWVCEEKQVSRSVLRWLPQNARCFLHEFLFEQEWFIIAKRSLQYIDEVFGWSFQTLGIVRFERHASASQTRHYHASFPKHTHKSIYSIPLLLAGDLHAFAAQFYSLPLAFFYPF